ncbi:MAG: hypothetical protein H0S79_17820 [Anaerolineaceae bacterium]|nr:hypothetical protein [Anaerolineaceae bacterium]
MDAQPVFSTGPKAFILASDGAFTPFHPENDQVWELQMPHNEVYPFCLHTTYGLRCRSMCLFPVITIGNKHYHQASSFFRPPAITQYLPDSITVQSSPDENCQFVFQAHIPAEDVIVGSVTFSNTSETMLSLTLDLAAILVSMPQGTAAYPDREGINQIISGHTKDLSPVLFMTGGPSAISSPYPALSIPIHLAAGQSRKLTWALATKTTREASLDAARKVAASPWQEAVQQHAKFHAARSIQVQTGNPDWDSAFMLAQTEAQRHWIGQPDQQQSPFFLRSRLPDDAPNSITQKTRRDDLSVLETLHLKQVLLPARSDQLSSILANFLSRQKEDGSIYSEGDAFAFSQPFHECPLLASLALKTHEIDGNEDRLRRTFPALCNSLEPWLPVEKSAWEDTRQLQMDTGLFSFDIWEDTGHGLDIHTAESPALLAMLLMEVNALARIASLIGEDSAAEKYQSLADTLSQKIQQCWDDRLSCFIYRDIESGQTPDRELFYPGRIQKELSIGKAFLKPQRLQLHIFAADEHTRACIIRLKGTDPKSNLIEEVIKSRDLRWVLGKAHLTSRRLYQSIQSITFDGLQPEDRFVLETADFSQLDISCLLPLLTPSATPEMIEKIIANPDLMAENGRPFGLAETWKGRHELPPALTVRTNLLWNTLIIEGLLHSGKPELAADLFTQLLRTITTGLAQHDGFFPFYNKSDGLPAGNRNAIAGLAPLGLLLELAGIRILSPNRVILWEHFPFANPLKVHWLGLSIYKDSSLVKVIFPDGTDYTGTIEEPVVISAESDKR